MAVVVKPSRQRINRLVMFAVLLAAATIWFAYDGWIGWPRHNAAMLATEDGQKAIAGHKDPNGQPIRRFEQLDDEQRQAVLKKLDLHSELDLRMQKIIALCLAAGVVVVLVRLTVVRRARMSLDDDGLQVGSSPLIPWDHMQELDLRRWEKEGLAYLKYGAPGAHARSLKLDEYQWDGFDALVEQLQKRRFPSDSGAG